jgi:RIO-like serine/threonine protein kinase
MGFGKHNVSVKIRQINGNGTLDGINTEISLVKNGKGKFHGHVYQVLDDYAVKIYNERVSSKKIAIKEFNIMKDLYENGAQIPKPEGVYEFSEEKRLFLKRRTLPGVVMQNIKDAKRLDIVLRDPKLEKQLKDRLRRDMGSEVLRCQDLGYNTWDVGPINTLWSPNEDKIYLIDFTSWEKKDE